MTAPFFSILVVSFRAGAAMGKTIQSILSQTCEDYEIVVKDGGSDDDTLSYVPEHEKIRVYSQKDGGIYDGMNEAIGYARGRYVCFLNCGDVFAGPDVLTAIKARAQETDAAVVYGNYARGDVRFEQPHTLSAFHLYKSPLCHQTMFIDKTLYDRHGRYDTSFKICADWCHLVKTFRAGETFAHTDVVVCDYEGGGASENEQGERIKQEEITRMRAMLYTERERQTFDRRLQWSCIRLRRWIANNHSLRWLKRVYRRAVDLYNRR